ncbi:MAG TPA: Fur family transcriptional regulator [Anaerohalosphaeraceae bacterium]|nr:Fur family transcriptional regulator [Anaerohalosphaeraceae bacterium]
MDNEQITIKVRDFEKRCRESGLKLTPQRSAVYKALINTDMHPTAEDIYREVRKEMPAISLDTVNRTLLTLAEIGAAFIVEGTGQPRRFDGGLEDHQHFLCIKCGKVIDFHHPPFDNIQLPNEIEGKFKVLRKTVYLEGLCEPCQNQSLHNQTV